LAQQTWFSVAVRVGTSTGRWPHSLDQTRPVVSASTGFHGHAKRLLARKPIDRLSPGEMTVETFMMKFVQQAALQRSL